MMSLILFLEPFGQAGTAEACRNQVPVTVFAFHLLCLPSDSITFLTLYFSFLHTKSCPAGRVCSLPSNLGLHPLQSRRSFILGFFVFTFVILCVYITGSDLNHPPIICGCACLGNTGAHKQVCPQCPQT